MILPITHGPCLWPALIMTIRRSSTRRSTAPSLSANRRSNVQQKSEGETLSMHALRFRQSHLGALRSNGTERLLPGKQSGYYPEARI